MDRRFLLSLLLVTPLTSLVAAPAPVPLGPRLELRLKAVTADGKSGRKASWEVSVINRGARTVTLVQPGDGSDCGWRTPIVEWGLDEVETKKVKRLSEGKGERKPLCLREGAPTQRRCGNINPLRENEVFDLAPGQEVRLNVSAGFPHLLPGKHKVVVRYFNLPDHPWKGVPLGEHDKEAMRRVRGSLKVALQSNPVEIMVDK